MTTNRYFRSLLSNLQRIKEHSLVPRNDMLKVLVDTRQLMESENLKGRYALLNLFLNWCLHPNISESKIAHDLLYKINAQCSLALQQKTSEEEAKQATRIFIHITENVLNIPSLRQEFRSLFEKYHLPKYLFDVKSNWDAFMKIILEEIIDKPLTFPKKILGISPGNKISNKHKAAFETLQKIRQMNPSKPLGHIIEIRIIKDVEAFRNMYCIELTSMATVKYVMQLKGSEPDKAFKTH